LVTNEPNVFPTVSVCAKQETVMLILLRIETVWVGFQPYRPYQAADSNFPIGAGRRRPSRERQREREREKGGEGAI